MVKKPSVVAGRAWPEHSNELGRLARSYLVHHAPYRPCPRAVSRPGMVPFFPDEEKSPVAISDSLETARQHPRPKRSVLLQVAHQHLRFHFTAAGIGEVPGVVTECHRRIVGDEIGGPCPEQIRLAGSAYLPGPYFEAVVKRSPRSQARWVLRS